MRVCVCGAQSVFMRGGAELLHENLVEALRRAGHEAELVHIPTDWSRPNLMASAFAWRLLAIPADVVIATNFPSYFVRHRRKVVWLTHQHRAAYDALSQPWSDFGDDDVALEQHREVVEWDSRVLSEARRLFTISQRVAERLRHYNGLDAEVLYHPPPLWDELHGAVSGQYVFCATRLEANKRPDLMIEAMAHVRSHTRMVIAGNGSMLERLDQRIRELGLQSRVSLLGFVDDARVVDLFAKARGVVYVPHDEDYGYVTLQAFYARKPVVTTDDSGGVLEWVRDGVTGFVAAPNPAALGQAIDRLAASPQQGAELGEAGSRSVADLDWAQVVDTLLSA